MHANHVNCNNNLEKRTLAGPLARRPVGPPAAACTSSAIRRFHRASDWMQIEDVIRLLPTHTNKNPVGRKRKNIRRRLLKEKVLLFDLGGRH